MFLVATSVVDLKLYRCLSKPVRNVKSSPIDDEPLIGKRNDAAVI
jgi:hypothetical protein